MRIRKKPWADQFISDNEKYVTDEPKKYLGKWQERFEKQQPLYVEVGTGKGQFIIEMAKRNPHINFIGVEIQRSVIAVALKKLLNDPLPNLQLVITDGGDINEIFYPKEVAKLFLNFSDPWPKKRHAKRRLTSPRFLDTYKEVLSDDGNIEFKTDNRGLFEYSLTSLNNYGMKFEYVSLDLHKSPENEENVETEYEQKFSKKGPIYKLIARFNEAS
ncbi:tRNA (guanosine(46)-N7)-methyltransferase TrmB [Lentilactobacillus laojiaonis]|uniref:tRNA (guanosine(46)-N7)-methyltransferase TrmB n=1 Tax=Lentilactobacillus laojiaonis TaxID=2883998 RepID=UPI001D0B40A7|nr:tRNA (guanosine(46)-N7)-methyltransferase TrmB [Lentilactobacillus laojiaonis]UDM32575.1 tRNA (guanosine(46)-N7)-methyltransferase TrmB [Lentilactobacillus laojiaonis]